MSSCNKSEKQYGLIIPKKQQPVAPKVSNIFANDNISDEEDGTDWVRKAIKAEGEKNKIKKQTKLSMQKALKEDPTIYQYDEVYDEMERTKSQSKLITEEKKKPKYIQNLLKAAERRKKEQEHRIERMVQKEREAEGAMFADKESFVTSAYRAKLEEFKKMEEEESRMDRLEAIGDVTKQQDMSGFYRHLYEQTMDGPKEMQNADAEKTDKANSSEDNIHNLPHNEDSIQKQTVPNDEAKSEVSQKEQATSIKKKSRQYRQRVIEEDESDVEVETKQEVEKRNVPLPVKNKNVDNADINEPDRKKQKQEGEESKDGVEENSKITTENASNEKNLENTQKDSEEGVKIDSTDNTDNTEKTDAERIEKIEAERREKSKIWIKRTVGPVFEDALQRYYARKVMKLSAT